MFPTSRRVHHTHAPIAHQGSVMIRPQFHLLLRHTFPSLLRFSCGLLPIRFIPLRLIRPIPCNEYYKYMSFSSLSSPLSRFINSYMICIIERYTVLCPISRHSVSHYANDDRQIKVGIYRILRYRWLIFMQIIVNSTNDSEKLIVSR